MIIGTYYLNNKNHAICADCAQYETERGSELREAQNETGDVLECRLCREDIPFVGQGYNARVTFSEEELSEMLSGIDLPTPFDAGTCRCGKYVEAGFLWQHSLSCERAGEA